MTRQDKSGLAGNGSAGDVFSLQEKRSTLDEMARPYESAGRDIEVRIDGASQDLIVEALVRGCERHSWEDAQCVGRFYHYTIKVANVKFDLITTKPVTQEEATRANYLGMTLAEYRAAKHLWKK